MFLVQLKNAQRRRWWISSWDPLYAELTAHCKFPVHTSYVNFQVSASENSLADLGPPNGGIVEPSAIRMRTEMAAASLVNYFPQAAY